MAAIDSIVSGSNPFSAKLSSLKVQTEESRVVASREGTWALLDKKAASSCSKILPSGARLKSQKAIETTNNGVSIFRR